MATRKLGGVGGLLASMTLVGPAVAGDDLIGRWDLTVQAAEGRHPAWLEVRKSGRSTLVGSFVGQFGSARPISEVVVDGPAFRFAIPPQWERRSGLIPVTGRLDAGVIRGETTDAAGAPIRFEGRRAPTLDRDRPPEWGRPIDLLNGRDLAGWSPRHPGAKVGWIVRDGVLINETPGVDLRTDATFGDFRLLAEFRYPKGSNGGIYLRGRYEVQIEDDFGHPPESHEIGGVYGFLTPSVNASKPAGEWQSIDATLIGRSLTLVLNGERVIDRQAIPGITGGALDSDESAPGPIMLQGDHGPIEFRSIRITPAR